MIVEDFNNDDYSVKDLSYKLHKDRFVIRWKWPENIDIVYILKTNILEEFPLDNTNNGNVRMYTKEEYKEFNGYVETIKEVNQYRYYVFPAIEREDSVVLIKQDNGKNQLILSTGTPEISYEIREIKSLGSFFSKEKALQIVIESETNLNKDVLCYVKKYGSYPISKEDGICFDFIDDIYEGTNLMPKITVGKNEYIKVFIKDKEKYGNIYNLKRE